MIDYKYDTISHKKSKIKISDLLITLFSVTLIIILLSNPNKYSQATLSGFSMFALNVFPTLFPFIVISKLLTSLSTPLILSKKLKPVANKVFHASSSIVYTYFLSILCGYPIGAKLTGDLYENHTINDNQVKQFCRFCSTSGILFVIGTIGVIMFNSLIVGIIIYISHILGSFIGGWILSSIDKSHDLTENDALSPNNKNIITNGVTSSITSILVVGAYITLFCLFTQILCDLTIFKSLINLSSKIGISPQLVNGIFSGFFEMTNGCKQLSILPSKSAIIFATGLISFGGLSIILQSQAFLQNTKIKTRELFFTKLVHSICSIIVASIILLIVRI